MRKKFLYLLTLTLLSACSTASDPQNNPLTPMPAKAEDPSNSALKAAVSEFLRQAGAPAASRYKFSRADLNHDDRRDALVLLKNPYGYWCDKHGCTMLVFKAHDDHFTFVNDVQPLREPVHISTARTNGWNDLVVRVSGRWQKAKDVALQFNGQRYPSNPDKLPAYTRLNSNRDSRIFMD